MRTVRALFLALVYQVCAAQTPLLPVHDPFGDRLLPEEFQQKHVSLGTLAREPGELLDAKNPGLAALYSLMVPGLGELYVGEYGTGKYFSIAEVVLWLGFGSLEAYGNWLRDDARRFAVFHAGVDAQGKDDQFFVDIGNFLSVDDYNNQRLLERSVTRLYDPALGYSWQWDTDAHRASYRELRISHDRILNSTRFVLAAVIVNHLASAVNAARLAISHNNSLEQASRIDIHAQVTSHASLADGIVISVSATF